MHRFFLTNNLGGGGTNVSRLYDYIEKFQFKNVGILLNYYYLTGHAKPAFDTKLIGKISQFNNINDFVNYCTRYFKQQRQTSSSFVSNNSSSTISGYILDNGCGNFLRNLLAEGASHEKISNLIKPFLDFAESLGFDFSVALDFAMKYTYKANEMEDEGFKEKWKSIASNNEINLSLLQASLTQMKKTSYNHCILAPLHGYNVFSFVEYLDDVLQLEQNQNMKFGGFALGGIADTKNLDSALWKVPEGFTKNKKSAYLCYNLIKAIRSKTERHIHVLGAGNIYTLPFLIKAGANSSDCHSAWRRSSDGGIDNAKILIPLMDKKHKFINDKNCLEYVKIGSIADGQYNLNCGYSIKQIQNLLTSSNKEDFYFGEIIMFYEAMIQYEILLDFIHQHPYDYLNLLTKSLDKKLNKNYLDIIESINL